MADNVRTGLQRGFASLLALTLVAALSPAAAVTAWADDGTEGKELSAQSTVEPPDQETASSAVVLTLGEEQAATIETEGDSVSGSSSSSVSSRSSKTKKASKKSQNLKVTKKNKTVKAKALKKKALKVKAITVKNAKGKVSYKKVSGSKKLSLVKGGKIKVKKGTKKGTYKIKVKVTAKGNASYKPASKTITVKIKVKGDKTHKSASMTDDEALALLLLLAAL